MAATVFWKLSIKRSVKSSSVDSDKMKNKIDNINQFSDTISCVVIGTGSIGQRHIKILKSIKNINVLAFPVRDLRRLELESEKITCVSSWEQASAMGATHAIIATDTYRHPDDAKNAVNAGCHVLIEKPMAVDGKEALLSWQLANKAKKKMYIGCCLRFQEALNIFREKLPFIGKIYSVRIECQSYLPDWRPQRHYKGSYSARNFDGGVLRDLIHEIDYSGWLFGWPPSVYAKIRTTGTLGISAEDTADILWESQNGAIVSLTLDYLTHEKRRLMRAYGEVGILEWDSIRGNVTLSLVGEQPCEYFSTQANDEMYREQDITFLYSTPTSTIFDERLATGADGVRSLAICDAAREASQKKMEIPVNYPVNL